MDSLDYFTSVSDPKNHEYLANKLSLIFLNPNSTKAIPRFEKALKKKGVNYDESEINKIRIIIAEA